MKIVNGHLAQNIREQEMLKPANNFGYILLASEVEKPRVFKQDSRNKKALIKKLKVHANKLKDKDKSVTRADIFTAIIIPPGSREGRKLIVNNNYTVHPARFDLVILIECQTLEQSQRIQNTEEYKTLHDYMKFNSNYFFKMLAKTPTELMK